MDLDPCPLRPVLAFLGIVDLKQELMLAVEQPMLGGEPEPAGVELVDTFGVVDVNGFVRLGVDASVLSTAAGCQVRGLAGKPALCSIAFDEAKTGRGYLRREFGVARMAPPPIGTSRSRRGSSCRTGFVAFDENSVFETRSGPDEGDQVGCVDGPPAGAGPWRRLHRSGWSCAGGSNARRQDR